MPRNLINFFRCITPVSLQKSVAGQSDAGWSDPFCGGGHRTGGDPIAVHWTGYHCTHNLVDWDLHGNFCHQIRTSSLGNLVHVRFMIQLKNLD